MDFEHADALNQAIRQIAIRHRARAGALLAELGLYPGQELLLLDLDAHGPRIQVELAGELGCEPPSITQMVRKLEAAGLISRRPSPRDSRATIVELTDRGRDLIPHIKEVWRQLAEIMVAGLTTTSPNQLFDVVDDLARSLSSRGALGHRHVGPEESA